MNSCPTPAIRLPARPFPCWRGRVPPLHAPLEPKQTEQVVLRPLPLQPAMAKPLPPMTRTTMTMTTMTMTTMPTTLPRKALPRQQPPDADERLRDVLGCDGGAALEVEACLRPV